MERLRPLYLRNPSSLGNRVALIEALLLDAAIGQARGSATADARSKCQEVRAVIGDEIKSTMNYQLLDPWVRANLCLQQRQAIDTEVKRLKQINYRDLSYLQFLSTNQ